MKGIEMKKENKLLTIAVTSFIGQLKEDFSELVNKPYPRQTRNDTESRDTIIVQDVSGSTGSDDYYPTRLSGGIEASVEYISIRAQQCLKDRIAIVAFDDTAWVVIGLSPVSQKDRLIEAVRGLNVCGGTDIAEGLRKAADIFSKHQDSSNKRHIILLTDGHGGHPVKIANKLKDEYRAVIDVVGIGGSHEAVNESLLRKVATTDPDGFNRYRFIKDSTALKEHYKHLATGLIWHRGKK